MASFVDDRIVMDGLTFDDVLLIPAYSEVLPRTVELKTRFSRNIELNIPFVTAAMESPGATFQPSFFNCLASCFAVFSICFISLLLSWA